ncbi:MAG: peptidase, partial [Longicatena sp.]
QMRAERERRESILRAEGEKRSNILTAEGEKEAIVLRATAQKEKMIAEAEGQAQAMERIYQAQARGIEMIKNAHPTKEYLSLKGLETYEKIADGKATKLIVPSDLQNMASMLTSAREILVDDAQKDFLEETIATVTKAKK